MTFISRNILTEKFYIYYLGSGKIYFTELLQKQCPELSQSLN